MKAKDLFRGYYEAGLKGEHSDLIIRCGSQVFHVHKLLFCKRSAYFDAFCQRWKRGNSDTLDLRAIGQGAEGEDEGCDDPDTIRLMIEFMYRDAYTLDAAASPGDRSGSPSEKSHSASGRPLKKRKRRSHSPSSIVVNPNYTPLAGPMDAAMYNPPMGMPPCLDIAQRTIPRGHLVTHVKMYMLALKYHIPELETYATESLQADLGGAWDEADFADCLVVAMTQLPRGVRGVREVLFRMLRARQSELLHMAKISAAADSIPDLYRDLCLAAAPQGHPHETMAGPSHWQFW